MKQVQPRWLAAHIIDQVTDGRSLSDCLQENLSSLTDKRDRAFVQAVCFGVCRHYTTLDVIISHLLESPMKAKDSDVHALLLVGLYQLMFMRVPEHAAVAETVNATSELNKTWSRGFVNAILRSYLREKDRLAEHMADDEEAQYAHPYWWIKTIREAWPQHWQAILEANNAHPPMSLRVNARHMTREAYCQEWLAPAELKASDIELTQCGIMLNDPVAIEDVPGFAKGLVSVQDGAAQLAAELLQLAPGQCVLDACAAPGGKLSHILELEPELAGCVAVENDKQRMRLINENLQRIFPDKALTKDHLKLLCYDAADTKAWSDSQTFDRILLDAPCSASGVIRRHPDIKLLRQPQDIKTMAATQLHLLNKLWDVLKPGGLLLYATCSIFPQENSDVIDAFLANHANAKEQPLPAIGIACRHGQQILPGMHDMDGFYYVLLQRSL